MLFESIYVLTRLFRDLFERESLGDGFGERFRAAGRLGPSGACSGKPESAPDEHDTEF
jgi:hypothetical protein